MPSQSRFTDADRIRAIEENGAEFLLAMGRAAGAEEHRTPEIHWVIGSSPIDYHNCVVRAQLTPDTADVAISASIERFEAHGVPGSWHVGPSMQPPNLRDRLRRHGFVEAEEDIGMAIDLGALPEAVPVPESFTIERVVDERGLTAWTSVIARSFGEGESEAAWVGEVSRRIGLSDEVPWRHFLGRLAGEPVATAWLFVGAGAAGVYFVSTRPSAPTGDRRSDDAGRAADRVGRRAVPGRAGLVGSRVPRLPAYGVQRALPNPPVRMAGAITVYGRFRTTVPTRTQFVPVRADTGLVVTARDMDGSRAGGAIALCGPGRADGPHRPGPLAIQEAYLQERSMTEQTATSAGQISVEEFRSALQVNWREAFEEVTGIFLDKGTSMFETLATISAEEASRPVGGGCSNIAAQVNHVWFYLDIMNRLGRGEDVPRPVDWDGSWQVGEVDEAEWQRLVAQLRDVYEEVNRFMATFDGWNERMIGGAFGMLAHTAYHLGEIRTGLCVVKGSRDKGA